MHIGVEYSDPSLRPVTAKLMGAMLSPLCGLDQRISFMLRSRDEARFMTAGAELTGVHLLRGEPKPKVGSYHLGGSGLVLEEALIRTLGETVERYSQLVAEVSRRHAITFQTFNQLRQSGERIIRPDALNFFEERQYARPGFPFQRFSPESPLGWMKLPSLVSDSDLWVPAQLVLVGYGVKGASGEPWLLPAVTTGSAAHTAPDKATLNALLELIQIDSAMGHWYSASVAPRITLDQRTAALQRLIQRHIDGTRPEPSFFWLQNPDLPGMSIACMVRERPGNIPAVAVGLGSDLNLVEAMYKALLEAVGVAQLAKITLLDQTIGERAESANGFDPDWILDLDSNVALYATPGNTAPLEAKFDENCVIAASDLPSDSPRDPAGQLRLLVEGFRTSAKELVFVDLTTDDIRTLGFTAVRVWSPDTLSLSLPSAPPAQHPRFLAYGGFHHARPHPYP